MTDDSDADPQSADGDDDTTADSQIDDVLDRLESSVSETAEPPLDDSEPNTATDSPTDSLNSPTDISESPTNEPKPTDISESPTNEPNSPTEDQPAADRSDGGRLWDRFGSGRQSDEQSSSQSTPSESEPATPEFSTDDDNHTPDADDDQSIADRVETADGRTSFRSILDRISHRLGSAGELIGSGGDGPTHGNQSPATRTDSDTETTASTDEEPLSPTGEEQSTSAQRSNSSAADQYSATRTPQGTEQRASGRDSQSARIDQVLENIDMFGRATASSQVLLLSPTAHSVTNDIYQRVLLPTDGTGQNILFVSAIQSSPHQVPAVRKIPEWTQGETGVIEVGQSVLGSPQAGSGDPAAQLDVYKQMSNFQNLAKLGVNISHITSQWSTSQRPTVVGVHTLSSIQQYVGNESMFQFLFTLKGQLNSLGVRGFYHMDPAVHTENELNTINSAFDIVLTVSSDGSIDIE